MTMQEQIDKLIELTALHEKRLDNIDKIIDLQQKQVNLLNDSINMLAGQTHHHGVGDMEKNGNIIADSES